MPCFLTEAGWRGDFIFVSESEKEDKQKMEMRKTHKIIALVIAGIALGYVLTKKLHLPMLSGWTSRLKNGRGFGVAKIGTGVLSDPVDSRSDIARMEEELGL